MTETPPAAVSAQRLDLATAVTVAYCTAASLLCAGEACALKGHGLPVTNILRAAIGPRFGCRWWLAAGFCAWIADHLLLGAPA